MQHIFKVGQRVDQNNRHGEIVECTTHGEVLSCIHHNLTTEQCQEPYYYVIFDDNKDIGELTPVAEVDINLEFPHI